MPKNKNNFDNYGDLPQGATLELISQTLKFTAESRLQFITPEAMLFVFLSLDRLRLTELLENSHYKVDVDGMRADLKEYLDSLEKVPAGRNYAPMPSASYKDMLAVIARFAGHLPVDEMMPVHYITGMLHLQGTFAKRTLDRYISPSKRETLIRDYADVCEELAEDIPLPDNFSTDDFWNAPGTSNRPYDAPFDDERDDACARIDDDALYTKAKFEGRADEINRTIITLLKVKRGNVVYVGERGVGKSSMVTGLIQAKERFNKKSRFGGAHFYKLNPSAIVTGVSYADEIENHVADIVDEIEREGCMAVIFADNMGELMPQNQNDNTPDTLRLLMSLIEGKDIHIITTASFEQFKRLGSHNASVEKNFTRIDIVEPPLDPDGRKMVRAAAANIVDSHNAPLCPQAVLDYIIDTAMTSYSKDIAMPGRALDLLDGVCAFYEVENSVKRGKKSTEMSRETVDHLLKSLGYDAIVNTAGNEDKLRKLEPNLLSLIFGQDEAVHRVAESVLLAKAGLSDDTKPLAAYLFVGPTGVGKTELAKALASQLGVKLERFDMSEYSEAHTVSKLVGSPAGYVGYDDGGLLTDAVRKNPNCVLLFDEIEKAHTAVFNLLLQVLDYAQLTDNKGQKADFSGTIIIMTSNAGARFATGRGLGFGSNQEKSEVMGTELKRVFAPEFLNRLTQIVAFHDMSRAMAERILDRKVGELKALLEKKRKVTFALTDEARQLIIDAGFSSQYGAREMDRAIGRLLKPALMQALLFGKENPKALTVEKTDDGKLLAK